MAPGEQQIAVQTRAALIGDIRFFLTAYVAGTAFALTFIF